jgi:hypothetical protein
VPEDELLISVSAAILLSQRGREPDDTEIRTAVDSAFKLQEEVKKRLSKMRAEQTYAVLEQAKEKSGGGS